jgi:hypothetical protein
MTFNPEHPEHARMDREHVEDHHVILGAVGALPRAVPGDWNGEYEEEWNCHSPYDLLLLHLARHHEFSVADTQKMIDPFDFVRLLINHEACHDDLPPADWPLDLAVEMDAAGYGDPELMSMATMHVLLHKSLDPELKEQYRVRVSAFRKICGEEGLAGPEWEWETKE